MMAELEIQRDVPLAPLTTFELGGPAKYFVQAASADEVVEALQWAEARGERVAVLGGGSNVIVPDHGFDGVVIHMVIANVEFGADGTIVAGAGVPWELVVGGAVTRNLAGLECLTGIPGSTGATPIQNVGAYGQEVASTLTAVSVIDRQQSVPVMLGPTECEFGYRDSIFKRQPARYVVCEVRFRLEPGGSSTLIYPELRRRVGADASLGEVRNAVLDLRRSKSMVIDPDDPNRRSAGSFFLNPIVTRADAQRVTELAVERGLVRDPGEVPRYPTSTEDVKLAAGWLIEKAGIARGTRRGAVGVSTRHALALVHHGGGTTDALLSFSEEIRTRVLDRFGVSLEREPRLLE